MSCKCVLKKIQLNSTIILLLLLPLQLNALELKSFFSKSEINYIRSGKILTSVQFKGSGRVETKPSPVFIKFFSTSFHRENLSKYDIVSIEKGFLSNIKKSAILRTLNCFSLLKGMRYYSRSENKIKTLVLRSYKLSSFDINESVMKTCDLKKKDGYFFIEDNRLGAMNIGSRIYQLGEFIVQRNVCVSVVRKWGLKIFEPGDFLSYRIFIKTAGGYYYFSIQLMKVRSKIVKSLDLFGPENFGNRLRADTVHLFKNLKINRIIDIAPFR